MYALRKQGRSYCNLDGKSNDFRLFFISLSLRGLQIKDLRCSATAVGCLPIREPPACACTGLPINLLLLLIEFGVVSIEVVLISGNGANKFEYRPLLWFLITEVRSGVVISDVGSGRNVAMETLLLGWRSCAVDCTCTGGLMAMDTLLLGLAKPSMFVVIELLLAEFSLPFIWCVYLFDVIGDWGGKLLVILLRGILSFEGFSGGFLSAMVFWAAVCLNVGGWAETAARDLLSCFSLVFLSSAIWFSRSRTCQNYFRIDEFDGYEYIGKRSKRKHLTVCIYTFSWRLLQWYSFADSLSCKVCRLSCNFFVSFSSCLTFSAFYQWQKIIEFQEFKKKAWLFLLKAQLYFSLPFACT